jgi:hypothetical protein
MTTALEGGEGSASRPGRSLPPGKTRYPFYRRPGGPQGQSGQSPPPGFDTRTVQPVAGRYTHYATRPYGWRAPFIFRFGLAGCVWKTAQEAGWAPGPVWTGEENLAATGIRSPDRPARSQSLYRLRYPDLWRESSIHISFRTSWVCLDNVPTSCFNCIKNKNPCQYRNVMTQFIVLPSGTHLCR